jgi:hypothetical protein
MGILDRLSGDPFVRQIRREPVLALPDGVGADAVERCARQWAPDVVRDPDGHLAVGSAVLLRGPIARTDRRWRAADVPAEAAACYVATVSSGQGRRDGRTGLILGLHRRLGGWYRIWKGEEWRDTSSYLPPRAPCVHAPVVLDPDDLVRVLDGALPGLRLVDTEPEHWEFGSAGVRVDLYRSTPDVYDPEPWTIAQPWYRPTEPVAEYNLYASDPGKHAAVEDALWSLVTATGGIALDEEGFVWRDGGRGFPDVTRGDLPIDNK